MYAMENDEERKVRTISAVEAKNDGKIVTETITWEAKTDDENGKMVMVTVKNTRKVMVSADGLFILADGDLKFDPPDCVLKLKDIGGSKWKMDQKKVDVGNTTYESFKPEQVEVPAGKFAAIRVESLTTGGNIGLNEKHWYAPNTGVVKFASNFEGYGWQTWVLKSFTPGKE